MKLGVGKPWKVAKKAKRKVRRKTGRSKVSMRRLLP